MTDKKIVLLTALKEELAAEMIPAGIEVIYTGVGKINAAAITTATILQLQPALIINFGTVGSINAAINGLVEVSKVVQRDMLAMPLAQRGVTPLSEEASAYYSGREGVTCGTGDSFVTAQDSWLSQQEIDVVDMELFAIAHCCSRWGVAWRSFKYISDAADDAAEAHWRENVSSGGMLMAGILREVLV